MLDHNKMTKASRLSFRAIAADRAKAGAPDAIWTQAYGWFQYRPLDAPISAPGFADDWHGELRGNGGRRQIWLIQLAGICASAIEQCLLYARERLIGNKPISDYQLVQRKISALATMEQILILNLDHLSDPALAQADHDIVGTEILRVAHDLSDLIVDHLGGIGYASYQNLPICYVIQSLITSGPADEVADV